MPPRKCARVSQAASPTPTSQPKTPTPAETSTSPSKSNHILDDPWTDQEEIGLFKGLMYWKPTGIHKHFRLLALHTYLLQNHYIHPRAEHTKPAGIWRKLNTLYDLEALDEREDARQLSDLSIESLSEDGEDEDAYSEAENKIHNAEFSLPVGEGYEEMKWQQRFASDGEDSPLMLPELNLAEVPPVRFTPSFSVEPSENATPSGRASKARGPGNVKGKGASGAPANSTRRSTRKAEEVVEEEEQEGEEEEDAEDGSESEEEDQSEESTPARSTRAGAAKGARSRGARGRGRGRTRR